MEQTRIIFTVTNDLNTDQRMQRICSTLRHAGFQVCLVGRKRKHSLPLSQQAFQQKRLTCWFDKGALFYAEFNIRLFFFLLFSKADIISAVDADTLLPCTLVSEIRSKKLAFDAHEYFTEVPELIGRNAVRNIWQRILNYGVPKSKLNYTVGPALAQLFSQQYRVPFDVIYNMPFRKQSFANATQPVILYQGDINEGRGLEQCIEAMQHIEGELWIAGDGLLKDKLGVFISELNVANKVKMLGKLKPQDLHQLTLQAKIGINVLEAKSESYRLSLANKFFDYVQAGVPVVCADFVEYQALNHQFEVAVLCNNTPKEIAAAVNKLLNDKLYYQKLAENCKLASKLWNWESQQTKLVALYNALCK